MVDIPLRPNGVRFYGMFGLPWGDSGGSTLSYENWDFTRNWKNQIDAAKAQGFNTFYWFGDVHWFSRGNIDLPTYLSRKAQVHQYLLDVGMYSLCYEAGSWVFWNSDVGVGNTPDYTTPTQPSWTDATTVIVAGAQLAAKYPNTIGIVTLDEPYFNVDSDHAGLITNLTNVYNAVKAVVPSDIPVCGCPNPCGNDAFPVFTYSSTQQTNCDAVAGICDFFAFHPFDPLSLSDSSLLRAAYPTKQIIMPSTVAKAEGSSGLTTLINDIWGLVGANNFVGAGYFISLDVPIFGGGTQTLGYFNSDYTPRSAKATPTLANISGTYPQRQSRRFRGNPRLNQGLRWGSL